MDISSVSIANQDGGLYFQMTLQASASGSNYYRIYYYPDTTGGYPWPTQYFVGYNGDLTATETGGGVSIIDAGFNDARTTLQWKVSGIPANATDTFPGGGSRITIPPRGKSILHRRASAHPSPTPSGCSAPACRPDRPAQKDAQVSGQTQVGPTSTPPKRQGRKRSCRFSFGHGAFMIFSHCGQINAQFVSNP
jgi:hypothetical protein